MGTNRAPLAAIVSKTRVIPSGFPEPGVVAIVLPRLQAERAEQFLETSILPGRVFASAEDLNNQPGQWLPKVNARLDRPTGTGPSDLLAADTAAMLTLPPAPPHGSGSRSSLAFTGPCTTRKL